MPTLAQDASRADELSRNAAQRFDQARRANAQGNASTAAPVGSLVDMTIDEATTRALERNLDLAVERLNPQTFDFSIASKFMTGRAPGNPRTIGSVRVFGGSPNPRGTLVNIFEFVSN